MDELPPDAKDFLALARGVHDPTDPGARSRVERRLASALVLGGVHSAASHPNLAATGKAAGGAWLSSGKIMLASALLMLAGGGAWLATRSDVPHVAARQGAAAPPAEAPSVRAPNVPDVAQPVLDQPLVEALPAQDAPVRAAADTAAGEPPRRHVSRHDVSESATALAPTLAKEAALLARVSERLSQRDTEAAGALLAEHRRRFPASQLREERDGFQVLAQCLEARGRARAEAADFVAKNPKSVLVPRIASACGL